MRSIALALAAFAMFFIGCNSETPSDAPPSNGIGATELPPETVDDAHAHAHPSEGPHHGALIELGAEEYHAELVHDEESGEVTIYVLDSAASGAVPIDAAEITINITHDGAGEQFELAASPDAGDPEGKSSRFVSNDEHLSEDLHDDHAEATLVLTIDGKSFRGEVQHGHDHGGNGHDH